MQEWILLRAVCKDGGPSLVLQPAKHCQNPLQHALQSAERLTDEAPMVELSVNRYLPTKSGGSYYIPKIGYRGGLSTTSDLVIVPKADGNLDFINAQTGKLIIEKFIGSA